jgi:hypothetical protein
MRAHRRRNTRLAAPRPSILGSQFPQGERMSVRLRNSRAAPQSKLATVDEVPRRAMRLPRGLLGDGDAPMLLVAGNRLEAQRLIVLMRTLRAPSVGRGALLVDTGERGSEVRDTLREHGLAADLRLPDAGGTLSIAGKLARLVLRVEPALIVAGGGSGSGLAAALAGRLTGVRSALLASSADEAPGWRWRLLGALHTWFYLGREHPRIDCRRGRAVESGDPVFDLCREQSEALGLASEAPQARVLVAWSAAGRATPGVLADLLEQQPESRIDWVRAPELAAGDPPHPRLRRLGQVPHWRLLALIKRAGCLLTDDRVLAMEARWFGRPVLWVGGTVVPPGCVACTPATLAHNFRMALDGALAARPLVEDGRAAVRLAGHLADRVEEHVLAGLLTRSRSR